MPAVIYNRSAFVNCPFDPEFQPLRDAIIFAVMDCKFIPRCSLESADSGEVRIEKICNIIRECRYGIHDISRTQLSPDSHLPRFNMPFELGLYLGAVRFGEQKQRKKCCLIFDTEPYRYQKFLSDIAGQDISAHHGTPAKVITQIRDWLAPSSRRTNLDGGHAIVERYHQFQDDLPRLCENARQRQSELTFFDLIAHISLWSTGTR